MSRWAIRFAAACAGLLAQAGSALAGSVTFQDAHDTAVFCAAAALSAAPPPSSDRASVDSVVADFATVWLARAVESGKRGAAASDTMEEINAQSAAISAGFKARSAPFYDLTACDSAEPGALWPSVPATKGAGRPRNGAVSLDQLADRREVEVYRTLTGRLRPSLADVSVAEAFSLDVRILALKSAIARAPKRDAGVLDLQLGEAFRQRRVGAEALNGEQAVSALEAAVQGLDSGGKPWGLAQRDLCFAYFTRLTGDRADDLERAIAACQAALPVLDLADTRSAWASTQLILAGAWHDRMRGDGADNLERAIAADRSAIGALSPKADAGGWAAAQANLCNHLSDRRLLDRPLGERQDNVEAAIAACEAAATVVTATSSPGAWRVLANTLAPLYADRLAGDPVANQERAITLLREVASSPDTDGGLAAAADYHLGEIYRARLTGDRHANLEIAVRYEQQALLGDPLNDRWPIVVGRALGEDLIALERYEEAGDALLVASRAAEELIGLGLDEAQERGVLDDVREVYTLAAYAAAKSGDAKRALALLSSGKARLLLTALSADSLDLSMAEQAELKRDRGEIREREGLLEETAHTDTSGAPVAARALDDLETLRREETALYEKGTRDRVAQPPAREVVTHGALLAPVVTDFGTELLVATPSAVAAFAAPDVTRASLNLIVDGPDDPAARGGWRRARGGRGIETGLNQVQPLLGAGLGAEIRRSLDAAGVKPGAAVVIMPDGESALLPLGLAKDPGTGRTLIEDYEISFTPSLAALAASHHRVARGGPRSLGLLRPPPGAALAYAPIEGELVAARFAAGRLTAWDGAEKDALLNGLGPRTYWHFATHGGFDWADPRKSGLLIGENSSLLRLSDLLDARRRIGAPRLVVLSACDSGLTDVEQDPDEFTGLPMGFIFAGAAGVVASLWPVNDLSTTLLMGRFYDLHLGEGQAPARALRAAELWLKEASLADLQAYVAAKRVSGVVTASQAEAMTDALERSARLVPAGRPIFASPRYWGAFNLYGQ